MREKSPRSNLRKRLLILRKKLERTASFPKKLFLGISPRRLILRLHSLRAAPFRAAGQTLLSPRKKSRSPIWCAGEDLNLHVLADTSPSSWPVYRFQHPREKEAIASFL